MNSHNFIRSDEGARYSVPAAVCSGHFGDRARTVARALKVFTLAESLGGGSDLADLQADLEWALGT